MASSWQEQAAAASTVRVSRSTMVGTDIKESPAELLEQARTHVPGLSLDEYTLARVMASENYSGSPVHLAVRGDADLNKAAAKGRSVFDHAAPNGVFGRQGRNGRPVATSLDPNMRHIEVAFALLRRWFLVVPAPARGISLGAVQYFDPRVQETLHREWKDGTTTRTIATSCSALMVLEGWTYGYKRRTISREQAQAGESCYVTGERRKALEWVGPIDGIDPWRGPMLFRPATSRQDELYAAARRIIETRGDYKGDDIRPGRGLHDADLVLIAAAGVATAIGAAG